MFPTTGKPIDRAQELATLLADRKPMRPLDASDFGGAKSFANVFADNIEKLRPLGEADMHRGKVIAAPSLERKPLDLHERPTSSRRASASLKAIAATGAIGAASSEEDETEEASEAREKENHDRATKAAQAWVAQTFFGAMLKQARQSPWKTPWLDGGRGGQAFGEMYDQQMADHMARGSGKKLVDSIVHKLEGAKKPARRKDAKTPAASANATPVDLLNQKIGVQQHAKAAATQGRALMQQSAYRVAAQHGAASTLAPPSLSLKH